MFGGLSINITGSGTDAQSAVRGVRERLQETRSAALGMAGGLGVAGEAADELTADSAQLALGLYGLASQADEVEDELSAAALSATGTTTAFTSLTGSTSGLSATMVGLSGSLTTVGVVLGGILALLAPVAAALGAAAVAAGALAGAFTTIIGSGMLAYGESLVDNYQEQLVGVNQQIERLKALKKAQGGLNAEQTKTLNTLKDERTELRKATTASGALARKFSELKGEIATAVMPLGQTFLPLIEDAVEAIPALVREMVGAVGGTDDLRDMLRQLGGIAQDVLPELMGGMFDIATRALPAFQDFVSFMGGKGTAALDGLFRVADEIGPELLAFAGAAGRLVPPLVAVGTVALEVLLPPLTIATNVIADLIGWFRDLPTGAKVAIGAIAGVGAVLAGLLNPITLIVGGIAGLYAAWRNNLFGIRDITESVVGPIREHWGTIRAAILWGLGPIGLAYTLWDKNFLGIQNRTAEATRWIRDHFEQIKTFFFGMAGPLAWFYMAYKRNFLGIKDATDFVIGTAMDAIDSFLSKIKTIPKVVRNSLNKIPKVNLDKLFPPKPGETGAKVGMTAGEQTIQSYKQSIHAGRQSGQTPPEFPSPDAAQQYGLQAGKEFFAGMKTGVTGGQIKSSGLTPGIKEALKSGVEGYKSKNLEDAPMAITEQLFNAVASTDAGATPARLGVSKAEFQTLVARYGGGGSGGLSTLSTSGVSGMATGGGGSRVSALSTAAKTFESAVQKFARAAQEPQTVVLEIDGDGPIAQELRQSNLRKDVADDRTIHRQNVGGGL